MLTPFSDVDRVLAVPAATMILSVVVVAPGVAMDTV